jgi:hypothetical protein
VRLHAVFVLESTSTFRRYWGPISFGLLLKKES